MKKQEMIRGFNRWLDEYIEDREKFVAAQELISCHLSERANGKKSTYGELCVETLIRCVASTGSS